MGKGFKVYFPDDGEDVGDAHTIDAIDHEDAVHKAMVRDWSNGGWERGEDAFPIVVVGPTGDAKRFSCRNEPDVNHCYDFEGDEEPDSEAGLIRIPEGYAES